MKNLGLFALFASIALMAGCLKQDASQAPHNGPLRVVCTTSMIADAARQIGGDFISVKCLMGPGVNPHSYKARESDVMAIAEADLVLYNGLHLEAKLADIFEKIGGGLNSVAVAEAIPVELLLEHEEYAGLYDPHVWFDISLWKHAVAKIRDSLSEADPVHSGQFSQRAENYMSGLDGLETEVRALSDSLPESQRILVTAHDAFRYFGRAYGFEVRGLQGISTDSQAGTGDVQSLSSFLAEREIRAVFIETSVPQRSIQAVQAATRAKGWDVAIGGELFSDSLGDTDSTEGNYIGMVRYNVNTIVTGLRGGQEGNGRKTDGH